eukprot:gene14721-20763_t
MTPDLDDLTISSAPSTNHERNVVLLDLHKQAGAADATSTTTENIVEAMGKRSSADIQGKLPQLMMEFCNVDALRMLRDISTRWLSQLKPVERTWEQYHVLVGLFDEISDEDIARNLYTSTATTIHCRMVDVKKIISLVLILPMLRSLNNLAQQRYAFIQDLQDCVNP